MLGTWLWMLTAKHSLFLHLAHCMTIPFSKLKVTGMSTEIESGQTGETSFHKFQEKETTVMKLTYLLWISLHYVCIHWPDYFFMLLSVFNLKNVNANRFNVSCIILKLSLPRPDWIHSTITIQQTATDPQHASITFDQVCSHVCDGILEKSWFVRGHG